LKKLEKIMTFSTFFSTFFSSLFLPSFGLIFNPEMAGILPLKQQQQQQQQQELAEDDEHLLHGVLDEPEPEPTEEEENAEEGATTLSEAEERTILLSQFEGETAYEVSQSV